jgi:hypothetical protein
MTTAVMVCGQPAFCFMATKIPSPSPGQSRPGGRLRPSLGAQPGEGKTAKLTWRWLDMLQCRFYSAAPGCGRAYGGI